MPSNYSEARNSAIISWICSFLGRIKILSYIKFKQIIISILGFQQTSIQRTNYQEHQEPVHILHGEARMYTKACLTPEPLLLTVLLVFNSQLACYHVSRLKQNTTQAVGTVILMKNHHECG